MRADGWNQCYYSMTRRVRRSGRSSASWWPIRERRVTAASSRCWATTIRARSRRRRARSRAARALAEEGRAGRPIRCARWWHRMPAGAPAADAAPAAPSQRRVVSRARDVVEVVAKALADKPERCASPSASTAGRRSSSCSWRPATSGRVIGRQGRTAAGAAHARSRRPRSSTAARRRSSSATAVAGADRRDARQETDDCVAGRARRPAARQSRTGDRQSGNRLPGGAVRAGPRAAMVGPARRTPAADRRACACTRAGRWSRSRASRP